MALRYAQRVNGLTEIAITKLDILSKFESIAICVAYELDGESQQLDSFPADPSILARCRPVYEALPGWKADITSVRTFAGLPAKAQAYVSRLEELAGVPATYISVGPGRDQTIRR